MISSLCTLILIALNFSAATLYFFFKYYTFFKEKLLFILFSILFSGENTFFYTFSLPKMVNLVIEDSSDFTFRDLMSLRV